MNIFSPAFTQAVADARGKGPGWGSVQGRPGRTNSLVFDRINSGNIGPAPMGSPPPGSDPMQPPSGGLSYLYDQYNSRQAPVGQPPPMGQTGGPEMRTMEFRDTNFNGIDDRDEPNFSGPTDHPLGLNMGPIGMGGQQSPFGQPGLYGSRTFGNGGPDPYKDPYGSRQITPPGSDPYSGPYPKLRSAMFGRYGGR